MKRWIALAPALALLLAGTAQAQEGWTYNNAGMSPATRKCTAVKTGQEVNTRLMRNGRDQMILVAARGDWNSNDPAAVKLSIDGAEPEFVMGLRVGPLLMVQVDKPGLEARLRTAQTLDWTTPWGMFHADVAGLGDAFDQVEACRA